ncbi:MAG: CopD family protein [Pseudohongiellaceae bacterium]
MTWTLLSVTSKVVYLAAMAAVFGGGLAHLLVRHASREFARPIGRYIAAFTVLGLLATLSFFLAQVGSVNSSGIGGMLDWSMMKLLMDSSLGTGSAVRSLGLLSGLLLALLLFGGSHNQPRAQPNLLRLATLLVLVGVAGLLFAWSTTMTGHVSTLNTGTRAVLGLHVLAVLAWMGSLWPLRLACNGEDPGGLQTIMVRYGNIAMYVVAALVVSGAWLALQLLNTAEEIITTPYGQLFLTKLVGVASLLLIAARHKLYLVPWLTSPAGVWKLKRSIGIEIAVAGLVLVVASALSTAVGPESGH